MPRNPDWSKDELILVLDVYISKFPDTQPDGNNPYVSELSEIMIRLGIIIHGGKKVSELPNYRSNDSVLLRFRNFAYLSRVLPQPGVPKRQGGMSAGAEGKKIRRIWKQYSTDKERLEKEASNIRDNILNFPLKDNVTDDEIEELAPEGGVALRTHRVYERKPSNRKKILRNFVNKHKKLFCEVCLIEPEKKYDLEIEGTILECHHLIPLSEISKVKIPKVSDFAILCPNCHRAIHRLDDCSDIDDLKKRVNR